MQSGNTVCKLFTSMGFHEVKSQKSIIFIPTIEIANIPTYALNHTRKYVHAVNMSDLIQLISTTAIVAILHRPRQPPDIAPFNG